MVNPIEKIREDLEKLFRSQKEIDWNRQNGFPKTAVKMDEPKDKKKGVWHLDVYKNGKVVSVVQYQKGKGLGVSLDVENVGLAEGPQIVLEDTESGIVMAMRWAALPILPCLGLLFMHSFYPWGWDSKKKLYTSECSIMGCKTVRYADDIKAKKPWYEKGKPGQKHVWGPWMSRDEHWEVPWNFARDCTQSSCPARQVTTEVMSIRERQRNEPAEIALGSTKGEA